ADLGCDHGAAGPDDRPQRSGRIPAHPFGTQQMTTSMLTGRSASDMSATVLETATPVHQTVRTPDPDARPVRLRAEDVSVFYGEKQALFDVSIDIPEKS